MLISNTCIRGLMPNLIEKSWTVSREYGVHVSNFANFRIALSYARLQHNLTQIDILQNTDYGHPMKPFFIEIPNFWAWADNLGK